MGRAVGKHPSPAQRLLTDCLLRDLIGLTTLWFSVFRGRTLPWAVSCFLTLRLTFSSLAFLRKWNMSKVVPGCVTRNVLLSESHHIYWFLIFVYLCRMTLGSLEITTEFQRETLTCDAGLMTKSFHVPLDKRWHYFSERFNTFQNDFTCQTIISHRADIRMWARQGDTSIKTYSPLKGDNWKHLNKNDRKPYSNDSSAERRWTELDTPICTEPIGS